MYRIPIFLLLLFPSFGIAQNFGGFPPATKWQQINTDTARIIYSPAAGSQATRIAQLVHAMARDTPVAVGKKLKKVAILLHKNTTQANGYVALGPFRSEFYLIPGADIFEFGNLPWHENLAVHEYRHVQQYNAFNKGLTKLFTFFGGQNGRALANAITVPDWFFEGDAVYAETAFTGLGRGRQPLFLSAFNSLWQEGKNYNWMKLRNGSLKDFVPNHYPLGYLLVNYGYIKYGPSIWQKVTSDASSFKGFFYPFQKGVKRHTHEPFKKFRQDALDYYKQVVPKKDLPTQDKTVTNYHFPQVAGKDSLIYLKESFRSLPAFYIKDNGGEHKLGLRNISRENWFRYANQKVAYTAFNRDKRWSLTDYSDIMLLDIQTKKERQLTQKGRYYTPVFNPDGQQLLSVFINDSLQTEIHIIRITDGAIIKKIRSRSGAYFIQPQFIDSDHIVLGLRTPDGLLSLQKMNLRNGQTEGLIAPQKSAIGNPSVYGDTLLFTASFSGNDDVYAYSLAEKKLYQLTEGETGNYYPAVYRDSLVWSVFTTMGLQWQQKALQQLLWKEIPLPTSETRELYPVALIEKGGLSLPERHFETKKYSKASSLINIHSWDPGLNLYSNNILNTLAGSVYYRYNEPEQAHTTGIGATYGGFFPVLSTRFEHTFNRHIKREDSTITANSTEWSAGFSIPLNFTKGKTSENLNFGSSLINNTFRPTGLSKNGSKNNTTYLHHFISWTQQQQRARQQIFPKLGYSTALQYRHRLDASGYQTSANAAFYLPAFSNVHSVVLTGSFQLVDTGNVLFTNRFSLARGYPDLYYSRMWNGGINYHMPLVYPDWGAANLFYLLRLRSNIFYDYSRIISKDKKIKAPLQSTGVELYFDTKWWNQLDLSFGVRCSYLLNKKFASGNRTMFEFIVPVNLIPF